MRKFFSFGNGNSSRSGAVAIGPGSDAVVAGWFNGTMDMGGEILVSANPQTDIFLAKYGFTVTGIGDGDISPSRQRTITVSPNPFNPATAITYRVGSGGRVRLALFDVRGTMVEVLVVDGHQKAGTYRFDYEASGLSTGVYFFRLQSGDQIATAKIALIK